MFTTYLQIEFEDSSIDAAAQDEENEHPKIKPLDVTFTKLKQWNLKKRVQWLHVTTDGHIYTANIFGDIELHNLSGRLLYQWPGVKPKGITSVTIDKSEYIAIVVNGADKSGAVIKLKEARQRLQSVGAWNIKAYEWPLGNNATYPMAKLQNDFLVIGFKSEVNDNEKWEIHILDCNKIPFTCVRTICVSHEIRSMCGVLSNLGEQLIACVTGFDGVTVPVITYSDPQRLPFKDKIWQFSGFNVQQFTMGQQLERLKEKMGKIRLSAAVIVPQIPSPGSPHTSHFDFFDSSTLLKVEPQIEAPNPVHVNLEYFYATDVCNVTKQEMLISELHNQEVLLVDSEGNFLKRVLTANELGSFAVEHMQSILPSQYLITVCSPKPFRINDQSLIVWRYKHAE